MHSVEVVLRLRSFNKAMKIFFSVTTGGILEVIEVEGVLRVEDIMWGGCNIFVLDGFMTLGVDDDRQSYAYSSYQRIVPDKGRFWQSLEMEPKEVARLLNHMAWEEWELLPTSDYWCSKWGDITVKDLEDADADAVAVGNNAEHLML